MSARRKPVDLSPEARADYTDILQYTEQRWSEQQSDAYSEILARALTTIGDNPGIGQARDDLRPGLRSYQLRQHVIYYRIERASVRIDRILHVRMDAAGHL